MVQEQVIPEAVLPTVLVTLIHNSPVVSDRNFVIDAFNAVWEPK